MNQSTRETVEKRPGMTVIRPGELPLSPLPEDPLSHASEVWSSPDGAKKVGTYQALRGAQFEYEQRYHESLYILSGRATFVLEDGTKFDLRAGDLAQILPGTKFKGSVSETMTLFFIITSEGPPQT
jgi:uncharacterized cupin superfamily protein